MENIVVISEDEGLRSLVVECAEALNYRVFAYHASQPVERMIATHRPAMVIVELLSRKVDGVSFTRSLRNTSDIPVVLLSTTLDEVEYVLASQAGADRIIRWPASKSVISVTIAAVSARYNSIRRAADVDTGNLVVGHLRMEPQRHFASWKDREVRLTATEFKMLARLVRRAGTVKSRDELIGADCCDDVNDRYVDSHIKRIRSKLREIDPGFSQIETLYGLGYRYVEDKVEIDQWRGTHQGRELRLA